MTYIPYPQIRKSLYSELVQLLPFYTKANSIRESVNPEFKLSGITIVAKLSFTHLVELIQIDEPIKRAFYETERIRENWSVHLQILNAYMPILSDFSKKSCIA